MSIRFGRSGNGYDSSEVMETEDDDWRKVTDLNERRKIQNRLAQRNYRRKLRQRLEELERQAGQSSGNSSSLSPKRRPRQPSSGVGTIIAASARDQTAAGPGGGGLAGSGAQGPVNVTLEERLISLESLLSPPSVSGESEDSPTTSVSSRGLYANDFGPLFLRPTAGPSEQPYSLWPPVQPHSQYSQPQPYNPGQSYLPGVSSFPPPPPPPPTPSGAASPESSATSQHQIQAYIPPSADHSLPVPLTPTVSLPQDPNTNISYQSDARQGVHIELPEQADFPALPPTFSPSPNINPNPWHLNPPLPHDEFYLTLNYSKLYNATMSIAKILNIEEADMLEDDTPSPFYREDTEEPPFEVPESAPDLRPTRMQQEIQHHPYIDVVPFKGFRDKLLDYVQKGEETGNYADETDICHKMYESWGVWGECPWEGRSWEIGEAFAR